MRMLLIVILLVFSSLSEATQRIVLDDGSEIRGEIVSMAKGIYTIRSGSLGLLTLPQSRIHKIESDVVRTAVPDQMSRQLNESTVQSIQSTLMTDPGIMSRILQLHEDPAMKAVLADQELMRAVQSMDIETLTNHPKIKELMNSARIRSIGQQVR